MSDAYHELKAQLHIMSSKLMRKDDENKRLKDALRALVAQNDSSEDYSGDNLLNHPNLSEPEDEDESDEMDLAEENGLPEAIQSHEFSDVYVCSDTACGGEVVEGVCYWCGTEHQLLEDEFVTRAISTESQAEHPDRSIVPRGDTPLREIDPLTTIPKEYMSRQTEYLELLRRGATAEMCEAFDLQFTHEKGICAWADQEIVDNFAGPAMETVNNWQIYLGRRVNLEDDDVDGLEFIEGLLDDASILPGTGNWVTEEECPGDWVTYPKYRGEIQLWAPDDMDLTDNPEENTATPVIANDYDLSDDDSEQVDLEMHDPAFYTTSGTCYSNVDRWYIAEDCEENIDETGSRAEDNPATMEGQNSDCSTISDSDKAGSDFDSDEVLSGDEDVFTGSASGIK